MVKPTGKKERGPRRTKHKGKRKRGSRKKRGRNWGRDHNRRHGVCAPCEGKKGGENPTLGSFFHTEEDDNTGGSKFRAGKHGEVTHGKIGDLGGMALQRGSGRETVRGRGRKRRLSSWEREGGEWSDSTGHLIVIGRKSEGGAQGEEKIAPGQKGTSIRVLDTVDGSEGFRTREKERKEGKRRKATQRGRALRGSFMR